MPRRNYGFEKRQKEIRRQEKKAEKKQKKVDRAKEAADAVKAVVPEGRDPSAPEG